MAKTARTLKAVDDEKPAKPAVKKSDKEADDTEDAWGDRDDELNGDKDIKKQVLEIAKGVDKGFRAQWERGNDQLDYWDVYDCVLGGKQFYAGNSQVYMPLVHEAIDARKTRFVNQIFPRSGRMVECITSDEQPYSIMALLEHYIRKTKLRTQVMPALMKNGDIEGQYNIYVGWADSERHIAYKAKPMVEVAGEEIEDPDPDAEDDVVEDVVIHQGPTVEVLADCDVLVLPHTSNSVGEALANGGSVTVIRRWTKGRIEKAIESGEIDEDEGEAVLEEMSNSTQQDPNSPNADKKHADAAGIQTSQGTSVLFLYETWARLKKKKERRLCKILYAGGAGERILSVKRNPYWNDKCPVLSAPQDKVSNVFKGQPKVKFCADLQYAANDAVNEAFDSAAYALMPIVMTDPAKNPRVGSMVLNLAAIWETDPNSTKFAQFPQLWKDGFAIITSVKQEIFQILSVSPAAIAQSTGGKSKRNQAEIANEQQVDILSTADVCTNCEDEILSPLLRWFVELDHQFRDRPLAVRQYGQLGLRAKMEEIPLVQMDRRYEFRWFGVEAARNAQMQQQQIAAVNVVKGFPPEMLKGYELNAVPFLSLMLESVFGPRITPEIFRDIKTKLTVEPEMENELLIEGLALPVHELDDDKQHMQEHIKALKDGDPTGAIREHMFYHSEQMKKKMAMQQQAIAGMQRGAPGSPGGAGPGAAGTPRPGAQPGMPRGGQSPPGAIHSDRLQDAQAAPRR